MFAQLPKDMEERYVNVLQRISQLSGDVNEQCIRINKLLKQINRQSLALNHIHMIINEQSNDMDDLHNRISDLDDHLSSIQSTMAQSSMSEEDIEGKLELVQRAAWELNQRKLSYKLVFLYSCWKL